MKNMKKKMLCGLAALAVAAMPMSALAVSKSGVYGGYGYKVTANNNYNSGTGTGSYNSTQRSMSLSVVFSYKNYDGATKSTSNSSSGTTYVSATTPNGTNVDQAYKKTVSSLYITGTTFSVQAGSF